MYVLVAVENVLSAMPLRMDASTRRIGTPPPVGMAARIYVERMNASVKIRSLLFAARTREVN